MRQEMRKGRRDMNMRLEPVANQKMYYSIITAIVGMIKDGKLQYGQKLYKESELVDMLQVSRPTLREALRVLEFLGIVTTRPRKGIVINDPVHSNGYGPLEMILTFEKTDRHDLFELRRALEIENAGNAASRASAEELQVLEKIDRELESVSFDDESFEDLHSRFHLQIARCSGNGLNFRLLNSVMLLIDQQVHMVYDNLSPEERMDVRRSHRNIYQAIISGQREKAEKLMRLHMNFPPMLKLMLG